MPIADLQTLDRVLVVGSFLRKDHPLLAHRLRQAAKKGAQISLVHSADDELLLPVAHKAIVAPPRAAARACGNRRRRRRRAAKPVPAALAGYRAASPPGDRRQPRSGKKRPCSSASSPSSIRARRSCTRWRRRSPSSPAPQLGCLTEAANSVAATVAGASPRSGRPQRAGDARRSAQGLSGPARRPEFDCANPVAARAALEAADLVVVLSPFSQAQWSYADVLLPIAPFTETAGTFVNCEGRLQRFNGVVKPLGETRPAWKVLRVLGTLLGSARVRLRFDRAASRRASRTPRHRRVARQRASDGFR